MSVTLLSPLPPRRRRRGRVTGAAVDGHAKESRPGWCTDVLQRRRLKGAHSRTHTRSDREGRGRRVTRTENTFRCPSHLSSTPPHLSRYRLAPFPYSASLNGRAPARSFILPRPRHRADGGGGPHLLHPRIPRLDERRQLRKAAGTRAEHVAQRH